MLPIDNVIRVVALKRRGAVARDAPLLAISVRIENFPDHDHLASYCGVAPKSRQSGTSISSVSASRQGNKRPKSLFIFSCNSLARSNNRFGEYYARCRARGIKLVAQLAGLARASPNSAPYR